MKKLGSLFSGIGGLELGLERAFGGSLETVWQVEKEPFCRQVLERHWAHAKRYDDVRTVGAHNLEPVDILCGGFPCQSISVAGKQEGLSNEEKSGLWWQFHRIISELRPKVVVLENVANVLRVGGTDVVGSLAQIGYDCEWTVIRASDFGAPHHRARWFCVAYPNSKRVQKQSIHTQSMEKTFKSKCGSGKNVFTHSNMPRNTAGTTLGKSMDKMGETQDWQYGWNTSLHTNEHCKRRSHWEGFPTASPFCRRNDGVPNRVDRIKALGNAVVPQCAEWIGQQIINSNLLEVV